MDVELFNPSISVVSALPAFLCNRRFDLILQRLELVGECRRLFNLRAIGERGNVKSRRSRVWQKGVAGRYPVFCWPLPRLFFAAIASDIKHGGYLQRLRMRHLSADRYMAAQKERLLDIQQ